MFYVGRNAGTTHVEAHEMRLSPILATGILAVLLVISALPAQAQAAVAGTTIPSPAQGENRMDRVLDMLESKGYDVSAIRSALASGDIESARTLLREFLHQNPGALAPTEPRENRMDRVLDLLESKGYDVSAIRSALASGDIESARTLLREFMHQNPGALGNKPGAAIGQALNGKMTGRPENAGNGANAAAGKVTPQQKRNGNRPNGK